MSFLSDVQVAQQGNSAELYSLTYSGREAFFTSYYRDIVHGGVAYKAVTISRSEIAVEFGPEEVQCTVRGGLNETFSFLRLGIPVTNVELTITRLFLDTDTTCDIFTGRLKSYSMRENEASCEFTSTLFFVLQQTFNQLTVWGTCGNMLFDTRCALARGEYKCTAIITEIGTTVEGYPYIIVENSGADAFGEGPQDKEEQYYALGMAQLADYYRMISDSEDADGAGRKRLVLEFAFPTGHVAVGDTIDIWPGCDKISHTCFLRFANYANFWGYQAVKAISRWNSVRPPAQTYNLELSKRDTPVYFGKYATKGVCVESNIYSNGTSPTMVFRYRALLGWGTITPVAVAITDSQQVTSVDSPAMVLWHDPPATDITDYFALFNLGDGVLAPEMPLPPNGWPESSDFAAWPQFPYLAAYAFWADSGSTAFPAGWPVADALVTQHNTEHRYELLIIFERVPVTPWAAFDRIEYETTAEVPPGAQTGYRNVYVGVNPVSAIYDILTNAHWGLGVAATDIDTVSFAAAAEYCYDKDYGIGIEILQKHKLRQVIDDICDAGGLMLCYSASGKIKCVAINNTAVSAATITDQDMVESEYAAGSWDSTLNRLLAKQPDYRASQVNTQERWTGAYQLKQDNILPQPAQNEANFMLTGSWRETTFEAVLLISTGVPARTRRMYEKLYEVSYPRAVITCKVDQRFANVSVGDCVQVQSVRYAVSGAFRVIGMTHGDDDARHIVMKLQQLQESTFNMDYVSELLATGYDEEGSPMVAPITGEILTFDAYSDTSIVSTEVYADRTRVRVAWYGHTVLSGALLTDQQDAVNYGCAINDEGGGLISVTLRSPQFDDAMQGNATGQLAIQVWEV